MKDGEIKEYDLFADDFGLEPVSKESIIPIGDKGNFSFDILSGKIDGPPLQMVLANAALLFYLSGQSKSLKDAYQDAKQIFDKGLTYQKMVDVRNFLKS